MCAPAARMHQHLDELHMLCEELAQARGGVTSCGVLSIK